jgi:hypothetical protein
MRASKELACGVRVVAVVGSGSGCHRWSEQELKASEGGALVG